MLRYRLESQGLGSDAIQSNEEVRLSDLLSLRNEN